VNLGRGALSWTQDVWDRLDQTVHSEIKRSSVAAGILPLVGPLSDALTVPADLIDSDRLAIAEDRVLPLVELSAEFTLTPAQVEGEAQLLTATSLAARAANLLAQAEDALLFQGDSAQDAPVFKFVQRQHSAGKGLVDSAEDEIEVHPVDPSSGRYSERTFAAVAEAYARLQSRGHYGPYALALRDEVYADTFAPLAGTLVSPADRIRPLVTQGFVGAGTLPLATGVFLSAGGNTVDLVIANDATTAFTQVDGEGRFHFRVVERFALRIKDRTALVRLRFADK
jgi:uncharacterized linocin/CFP29 family protein